MQVAELDKQLNTTSDAILKTLKSLKLKAKDGAQELSGAVASVVKSEYLKTAKTAPAPAPVPEKKAAKAEKGEKAEKAEKVEKAPKESKKEAAGPSLEDLSGIGEKTIAELKKQGYDTLEKLAKSNVDDLTQIKGLGKIKAEKIIAEAKSLLK